MTISALVLGMMAQAAITVMPADGGDFQIGYAALQRGDNQAAIEEIEQGRVLAANDPARALNHGIALVRLGDRAAARAQFVTVAREGRLELETATGQWVDSHVLAHKAMALLDAGGTSEQLAALMR